MLYLFALFAAFAGDPPRLPWHLNILVEREGKPSVLSVDYGTEEECVEGLALLFFSQTQEGVTVVNATCERDPFVT